MKKNIILFLLIMIPFVAQAQQVSPQFFGYFSLDSLMKASPDYAIAQTNMAELRKKYDAETKRSEQEFNKKYEEFLDGQRDFASSILQKRQAELQYLMDKNIQFKQESQRLLEKAHEDAFAPIKQKILNLAKQLGAQRSIAFVLNTDNDAVPYLNPAFGIDLNSDILQHLQAK